MRVDERIEIDGLRVPGVTGLMVLVNGAPGGRGADAGAVDVWDDAGRSVHLPLIRSVEHPQRVSVGPGHLVSARPGLPMPAFLSTAHFDPPLEAHRLAVTRRGGGFELHGLTLLLADGSSRAVVLRPDDPATVRVEGGRHPAAPCRRRFASLAACPGGNRGQSRSGADWRGAQPVPSGRGGLVAIGHDRRDGRRRGA